MVANINPHTIENVSKIKSARQDETTLSPVISESIDNGIARRKASLHDNDLELSASAFVLSK